MWLDKYDEFYETNISKETKDLVLSISAATMDRIFRKRNIRGKKKGFCKTRPGSLLKKQIPLKEVKWDVAYPGYLEGDTVAHCGDSMRGQFVYSVNFVDICTQWTVQLAVLGKGSTGVLRALKTALKTLPFKVLGFNSDKGVQSL
jgi:hypothetical protein